MSGNQTVLILVDMRMKIYCDQGHAGVLLDTGNEILFFEKISFELPYQLIRFEDRDQLKEYLMRCYDVDTTGECASPFILENDRVL